MKLELSWGGVGLYQPATGYWWGVALAIGCVELRLARLGLYVSGWQPWKFSVTKYPHQRVYAVGPVRLSWAWGARRSGQR